MTKAEIKQALEDYCEEYPRDIVMMCYDMLGANELYDGIPIMLEDWADMYGEEFGF